MIDFNSLKEKMSEDEIKKLDSGLARLRVLTPEARDQILMAMEAMINCENLKIKHSESDQKIHYEKPCNKQLFNLLKSKYDELKKLANYPEDIEFYDLKALEKILKVGTYESGSKAINILIIINLLKYMINPNFIIEENKVED